MKAIAEVKVGKMDGHGMGRAEACRIETSARAAGMMSAGLWRVTVTGDFDPVEQVEVLGVDKRLRRMSKVKV